MTDKSDTRKKLFTDHELYWLSLPYPVRISKLIKQKRVDEAIQHCEDMKGSQILLHDFFADSCMFLWSWVGDNMGEETVEQMFRYIFSQSAKRQYFDAAGAQVMPHLTIDLLARSWRAHSCFGAGEHPGSFSITEDDEKFTFHLHPCGSGARLWRKGLYEKGEGGKVSEKIHTWTYQRKGFPYYCIHCSFLNEILPYESDYGFLLWPVDPLKNKDDECAWHVYKDPAMIPDHYYKRLGLVPKKKKINKGLKPGHRFFSDQEFAEMAQPMPDRIIGCLQKGAYQRALKLCREVKGEFLELHDLYVMMLISTMTFISDSKGEKALGEVLDGQYRNCIEKSILSRTGKKTVAEKASFLANMIFNIDNCNRSGYHPGKFSIREDNLYIYFILNPCGSGGRLLRAGSYKPMPFIKQIQEQIENSVAYYAAHHLPLPEKLLKMIFPFTVTHFTQRKPYLQGKTKRPHTWSFNRKNIPYYCCQCGMIQEKLFESGLEIIPPKSNKDSCVWKLSKF
ncbi:MAG: hypothetical protein JRF40_07110 [Deltaproteobacteria bacterium]|nr:hypothetical protein [Deltaproteobacteria bacterium]MBW2219241.1 hypothetical protein [Deltaproteobacteria bacterium]